MQIEEQIAKAQGKDTDSKQDDDKEKDLKSELGKKVAAPVKDAVKDVVAAVKSAATLENGNETMDSTVARIVTYSDSEDEGHEKLKPRPAPELPQKRPPVHRVNDGAGLGNLHMHFCIGLLGSCTQTASKPPAQRRFPGSAQPMY